MFSKHLSEFVREYVTIWIRSFEEIGSNSDKKTTPKILYFFEMISF